MTYTIKDSILGIECELEELRDLAQSMGKSSDQYGISFKDEVLRLSEMIEFDLKAISLNITQVQVDPEPENGSKAKLNIQKAREIRSKYNSGHFSQSELAKEFGVCWQTVNRVVRNHIWTEASK